MLRRRILAGRDRMPPAVLAEKSRDITARLFSLPLLDRVTVVLVYMHFRSEVRTDGLIDGLLHRGRVVCIPKTLPSESRLLAIRISDPIRDVAPGYCGIPEPVAALHTGALQPPAEIDAVIVPGSVFDPEGGRLGYGGGYYDRFLSLEAPQAVRIALAYGLQVVDKVPGEPHDQPMDFVVTEDNLFACRRIRHAQDSGLSRRSLS